MGDGLFKMIEQKNPALAAEKYQPKATPENQRKKQKKRNEYKNIELDSDQDSFAEIPEKSSKSQEIQRQMNYMFDAEKIKLAEEKAKLFEDKKRKQRLETKDHIVSSGPIDEEKLENFKAIAQCDVDKLKHNKFKWNVVDNSKFEKTKRIYRKIPEEVLQELDKEQQKLNGIP